MEKKRPAGTPFLSTVVFFIAYLTGGLFCEVPIHLCTHHSIEFNSRYMHMKQVTRERYHDTTKPCMLNGRLSWCLVCANLSAVPFLSSIGEYHEAVLLTAGSGRMERTSRGRKHRRNGGRMGRPADKVHRGHEVASTGSGGRAKKKHMSQDYCQHLANACSHCCGAIT